MEDSIKSSQSISSKTISNLPGNSETTIKEDILTLVLQNNQKRYLIFSRQ